jgi:hypothetical protein
MMEFNFQSAKCKSQIEESGWAPGDNGGAVFRRFQGPSPEKEIGMIGNRPVFSATLHYALCALSFGLFLQT